MQLKDRLYLPFAVCVCVADYGCPAIIFQSTCIGHPQLCPRHASKTVFMKSTHRTVCAQRLRLTCNNFRSRSTLTVHKDHHWARRCWFPTTQYDSLHHCRPTCQCICLARSTRHLSVEHSSHGSVHLARLTHMQADWRLNTPTVRRCEADAQSLIRSNNAMSLDLLHTRAQQHLR